MHTCMSPVLGVPPAISRILISTYTQPTLAMSAAISRPASSTSLSSLTLHDAQGYTRAGAGSLFAASPELQMELEVAAKAILADKVICSYVEPLCTAMMHSKESADM